MDQPRRVGGYEITLFVCVLWWNVPFSCRFGGKFEYTWSGVLEPGDAVAFFKSPSLGGCIIDTGAIVEADYAIRRAPACPRHRERSDLQKRGIESIGCRRRRRRCHFFSVW